VEHSAAERKSASSTSAFWETFEDASLQSFTTYLLIEEVNSGTHASPGRQVNSVDTNLRVSERHASPDLAPAPLGATSRAARARLVQGVGEVEAERSTAAHPDVGDEAGLGALRAVDVDDGAALAGACRSVAAHDNVAYRHLATHKRTTLPSSEKMGALKMQDMKLQYIKNIS